MNKTLILVRHAHRVKLKGGAADNGLSLKGRKQAKSFAKWFDRQFGAGPIVIATSPKKRCVETVTPLTKKKKSDEVMTALVEELDEGGDIAAKARRFARWWSASAPTLTIACSHGDILPALLLELTGARAQLSKGACAVIELERNVATLTGLDQKPA